MSWDSGSPARTEAALTGVGLFVLCVFPQCLRRETIASRQFLSTCSGLARRVKQTKFWTDPGRVKIRGSAGWEKEGRATIYCDELPDNLDHLGRICDRDHPTQSVSRKSSVLPLQSAASELLPACCTWALYSTTKQGGVVSQSPRS